MITQIALFAGALAPPAAALGALWAIGPGAGSGGEGGRPREKELDLLERLASGLAHELKNPLGALKLNLQLLQEELDRDGGVTDTARARLDATLCEADRLQEVLDNFLRYARRRDLEPAEGDLEQVARDLLTFLKPQILGARVETRTDFAPGGTPCRADEGLVRQVLLNLLLNAVEAMPQGGVLTVSTRSDGDRAVLEVADTGRGIDPEVLPHVWDAYFSDKRGGTGLGLAIARGIIHDHGGTIDISSTPGRGTTVTLSIPSGGPR